MGCIGAVVAVNLYDTLCRNKAEYGVAIDRVATFGKTVVDSLDIIADYNHIGSFVGIDGFVGNLRHDVCAGRHALSALLGLLLFFEAGEVAFDNIVDINLIGATALLKAIASR